MAIRNKLYDFNVLKSVSFDVPIIVVGNIAVGGTGKTPMVSFLIKNLSDTYQIGVLSRGYGRKTKGFKTVETSDSPMQTGDEPLLLKKLHPEIPVVVCENRILGVIELLKMHPEVNLILMDDGFQHRAILPKLNIVLTTFQKPFWKDFIMPVGNLREGKYAVQRADLLVVTKTPNTQRLDIPFDIPTFYASINYNQPKAESVFGFSGLANNNIFEQFLSENYHLVDFIGFSDHYLYSQKDYNEIVAKANESTIMCTEKDAVKLAEFDLDNRIVPVKIEISLDQEVTFITQIKTHIES